MSENEKYVNVADLKRKLRYWCKSRGMSEQGVESLMETVGRLPYTLKGKLKTALEADPVSFGRWIYGENESGRDGIFCSECEHFVPWCYDYYDKSDDLINDNSRCPSCGTKMEVCDDKP